jgi:bis(5'-nucleosyl)-tetraphosphatase (symmetrical)
MLQGPDLSTFLPQMYGNTPTQWHDGLQGVARWRCVVNALTRLRFCTADGTMEFATKEGAGGAPEGYMPWFEVPGRRTAQQPVAFGHWSTLGLINRDDLLALDTGCVWGGHLTAVRLTPEGREVVQVPCERALQPGKH